MSRKKKPRALVTLRSHVAIDGVLGAYYTRAARPAPAEWPDRVYLTRDAGVDGKLSPIVEVWSRPPRMMRDAREDGSPGRAACWYVPAHDDGTTVDDLLGRYSLAAARAFFRTLPDTELECVGQPCR